ncbi:helix-turn-helix transcriptional regulator [Mesorhizobium sp. L-8-3]|uniref:helix-turn-helix transcriptional regulator n=1 Tax=Mesorhizobium sp. L-8-3 TaxID=2744522 RepID=UPI0019284099|nr:AraC family transcriptional regulator [Mesorhizobium sp. L-8-3]
MQPVPQVRVSAYLPFIQYMERQGAAFQQEFGDTLLPAVAAKNVEALVPIHLAHAFLARCARSADAADLGYVVGRAATVEGLGAFGRSLLRSLTLHDALGKVRSTFALYSSAERLWWRRSLGNVEFLHTHLYETGPGSLYAQQCALFLMRDLVRLVAGPQWQPPAVLITPRHDVAVTRHAFGTADVRVGEVCGIMFPVELLSLPFVRPLGGAATPERDLTAFEASAPANDFVGSVKQIIAALMAEGHTHLNSIAEALRLHSRTLQRKLSESEIEFSQLLAEVRFVAAARLLDDPRRRVIDVAFELGYADSANFTRAFRQWTGVSPSDFRRLREKARCREMT